MPPKNYHEIISKYEELQAKHLGASREYNIFIQNLQGIPNHWEREKIKLLDAEKNSLQRQLNEMKKQYSNSKSKQTTLNRKFRRMKLEGPVVFPKLNLKPKLNHNDIYSNVFRGGSKPKLKNKKRLTNKKKKLSNKKKKFTNSRKKNKNKNSKVKVKVRRN